MSRRARLGLFGAGALGLAVVLAVAFAGLPSFGAFSGDTSRLLTRVIVPERGATDTVTAITFDYRGFDTLGEEFILFAAVAGVLALLRIIGPGEHEDAESDRPHASTAARAMALGLVGPTVVLGLDIVAHGQLTPGGGFQGGIILAAAALLVFAAGSALAMRRSSPVAVVERAEAAGAAGLGLIGLGGLIFAGTFYENFLGRGQVGSLLSGGILAPSSVAVGLEVAGGITLLVSEFLLQDLLRGEGGA